MNTPIDTYERGSSSYENARYYNNLATEKQSWSDLPKNFAYSAPTVPEFKYKGQDVDFGRCNVNQSYFSIPPGTTFLTHLVGPTSIGRELYPTLRLPDGQYFYKNMERQEPVLNGKRFMYDTPFEDMNPIPGLKQVGYRRKIYPLTDEYPREINRYSDTTLPYPNW